MSDLDEYTGTGDNLPLEIEDRKDNIIKQYRDYLESLSREELIEKLTISQTDDSLIENIMEIDKMGECDQEFKPI